MARGGRRTPANPAPVSVPGSGARTDGGAGSSRQPLREMPADVHGERQAMMALQGAAPMHAQGQPGGSRGSVPPVPLDVSDPFRPTEQPGVGPVRTPHDGMPADLGAVLPPDPQQALRVLYQMYPHPSIGRLIRSG